MKRSLRSAKERKSTSTNDFIYYGDAKRLKCHNSPEIEKENQGLKALVVQSRDDNKDATSKTSPPHENTRTTTATCTHVETEATVVSLVLSRQTQKAQQNVSKLTTDVEVHHVGTQTKWPSNDANAYIMVADITAADVTDVNMPVALLSEHGECLNHGVQVNIANRFDVNNLGIDDEPKYLQLLVDLQNREVYHDLLRKYLSMYADTKDAEKYVEVTFEDCMIERLAFRNYPVKVNLNKTLVLDCWKNALQTKYGKDLDWARQTVFDTCTRLRNTKAGGKRNARKKLEHK